MEEKHRSILSRTDIRAAFVPQFRGVYGVIRFKTEDVFVDPETCKALIRWVCTFDRGERLGS